MESTARYDESDLLPLSGLQHLLFCERQCALIHVERAWRENQLTAEGRVFHERVDGADAEARGDLKIARGIPVRSLRLGLTGRADVVEFRRVREGEHGARLPGLESRWLPYPVEYKRGQPKWIDCDRVQLCAQALCIEEMLQVAVPAGAIYYGRVRRREEVCFDRGLRETTEKAAQRFRELVNKGETPIVYRAPKCRSCSLLELCLPPRKRRRRSVDGYIAAAVEGPDT
ncbi:MAG: CRISPR-associated protein Cas4 [Gemmatimonadetes bacterium]|nr:CRISPR-associated protein Cas4 [Gemmatimonadota bacterium]